MGIIKMFLANKLSLMAKPSMVNPLKNAATVQGTIPRMFGGGGHALRPANEGGRIKVTDQIIWINCIPPDGVPRRMAGKAGESLMEVLQRHKTPGIWADCDGGDNEYSMQPHQVPFDYYSAGVSCGQCAVHIPDPYFDKLN